MIVHVIVGHFVVIVSTKMEIKIRKINNFKQNEFKTNNKNKIVTEQFCMLPMTMLGVTVEASTPRT